MQAGNLSTQVLKTHPALSQNSATAEAARGKESYRYCALTTREDTTDLFLRGRKVSVLDSTEFLRHEIPEESCPLWVDNSFPEQLFGGQWVVGGWGPDWPSGGLASLEDIGSPEKRLAHFRGCLSH